MSKQKDIGAEVPLLMDYIHATGAAFDLHRHLDFQRQQFLRNYVEAQMVNFETSAFSGWFYWNFKVEGGYCAEWDFLRGLREGWIPQLPPPNLPSIEVFGSCFDILFKTSDNMTIVQEFPPSVPDTLVTFDDDVVNSHGETTRKIFGRWYRIRVHRTIEVQGFWIVIAVLVTGIAIRFLRTKFNQKQQDRILYTKIPDHTYHTIFTNLSTRSNDDSS